MIAACNSSRSPLILISALILALSALNCDLSVRFSGGTFVAVEKTMVPGGGARVVHTCRDVGRGITRCAFFSTEGSSETPLRWLEALPLLRGEDGGAFNSVLAGLLRDFPHPAFFFETTPATPAREEVFEFVLVPSPQLERVQVADELSFSEHIEDDACARSRDVVSFANLGGDALLVVPCKAPGVASSDVYAHIAPFVRGAPAGQVSEVWLRTANAMEELLERQPKVWLSTSGLGVFWTHFRLDSRPKYYQYRKFASM